MFLGKYVSDLDPNNRLTVPSAFRAAASHELYLTQGFDRNLLVLTETAFNEVYSRVSSLNLADPAARLLLRLILGNAHAVRTDENGFITVPDELRAFANLRDGILIVGQGDYFEVWSRDFWKKQESELNDAEANASRFAALTVSTW